MSWIKGEIDCGALILWLYGADGAGKSAIAHTLAEICEECGCLLATFFFWKTAAERNNIDRFIATIAYQIARGIPASRRFIETAIDADPMISNNPWMSSLQSSSSNLSGTSILQDSTSKTPHMLLSSMA